MSLQYPTNPYSSLRAVNTLSSDYSGTLSIAQPLMEELNAWSRRSLEANPEIVTEEIDGSGPSMVGHYVVKSILFRAILRPFNNASEQSMMFGDPREQAACQFSRTAAKACVSAFTTFTSNLNSSWIHAFWPFCMCDKFKLMRGYSLTDYA